MDNGYKGIKIPSFIPPFRVNGVPPRIVSPTELDRIIAEDIAKDTKNRVEKTVNGNNPTDENQSAELD